REKSLTTSVGKLDIVDESLLVQSDIEGTPQKAQKKVSAKAGDSQGAKSTPVAAAAAVKKDPKPSSNQKANTPAAKQSGPQSGKAANAGKHVNNKNQQQQTQAGKKGTAQQQQTGGKKKEQLKMDKNHFSKEAETSSSNSDESWEKEFELE
uniref:Uncharacterized protein n=1 Tax=Anopheles maculatus TaxID=74869 RepID=A0A182SRD1_9DIPT